MNGTSGGRGTYGEKSDYLADSQNVRLKGVVDTGVGVAHAWRLQFYSETQL